MQQLTANGSPKRSTIEAIVIRSDGTRENLGVISFYHRDWRKRLAWRLRHLHPRVLQYALT